MSVKIISFANHKGGVGKTTTTASVGTVLASWGKRVLLIDMDAQANLSSSFLGLDDDESRNSVYDVLVSMKRHKSPELPIINIKENLDIIPASLDLAMLDSELASANAREYLLAKTLKPIKEEYDFVLIDCPPSLGVLTVNATTASDYVIIPLVAEILPSKGLVRFMEFIDHVKEDLNQELSILGVLFTRWEKSKLSQATEDSLTQAIGNLVFKTKIRKNVKVAEAPSEAQNIVDYAPQSNGAKDYIALTKEILGKLENK